MTTERAHPEQKRPAAGGGTLPVCRMHMNREPGEEKENKREDRKEDIA